MRALDYTPLERLPITRPVARVSFIASRCAGRRVLDLGCFDETALVKHHTSEWLHGQIAAVAKSVLGVDSSSQIPAAGIITGPTSRIVRGDVRSVGDYVDPREIDVIVAGELIEHLPNVQDFLLGLKLAFADRELIATTPNATSLTNSLLAMLRRESSHRDHLQIFSYKTLNSLCRNTGFREWEIRPYNVRYTEMRLRSRGPRGALVAAAERMINCGELLFPLLAGGLILDVRRI